MIDEGAWVGGGAGGKKEGREGGRAGEGAEVAAAVEEGAEARRTARRPCTRGRSGAGAEATVVEGAAAATGVVEAIGEGVAEVGGREVASRDAERVEVAAEGGEDDGLVAGDLAEEVRGACHRGAGRPRGGGVAAARGAGAGL